jgi:hypothetical protein
MFRAEEEAKQETSMKWAAYTLTLTSNHSTKYNRVSNIAVK